jgi:hypothetical protein
VAPTAEKRPRVLESIAFDVPAKNATHGDRHTVPRFDDTDLSRRDDGESRDLYRVLPRPESKIETRRKRIGLVTSFAVQGDDLAVGE